ncbi:MAG: hypothetical protein ACK502_06140 [Alphaproteobacteria bacterium]
MPKRYDNRMDPADREDLAEHDPHAASRYVQKDERRTKGKHSGNHHVPGTQASFTARVEEKRNDPEAGQEPAM